MHSLLRLSRETRRQCVYWKRMLRWMKNGCFLLPKSSMLPWLPSFLKLFQMHMMMLLGSIYGGLPQLSRCIYISLYVLDKILRYAVYFFVTWVLISTCLPLNGHSYLLEIILETQYSMVDIYLEFCKVPISQWKWNIHSDLIFNKSVLWTIRKEYDVHIVVQWWGKQLGGNRLLVPTRLKANQSLSTIEVSYGCATLANTPDPEYVLCRVN